MNSSTLLVHWLYTPGDSLPPDVTHNRYTNLEVAVAVLLCLLYLLTVVNCLLVIVTVAARPSLHRAMNIYVVSLCISDVILTTSVVPLNVVSFFVALPYQVGCTAQRVALAADAALFSGIYSVVAIAVDRHRAIARPLNRNLGNRRSLGFVACIWTASIIITLPKYLSVTLREPSTDNCTLVDEAALAISLSDAVLVYLLPLCLVSVLYHRTIRVLGECERGLPQMRVILRKRRRAVHMIVAITSVFAICWFPFHLLGILARNIVTSGNPQLTQASQYLRYVSLVAILLNAWLNVLVYGYFSESFRRALFGILWRGCGSSGATGPVRRRIQAETRPGSLTSSATGDTRGSLMTTPRTSQRPGLYF